MVVSRQQILESKRNENKYRFLANFCSSFVDRNHISTILFLVNKRRGGSHNPRNLLQSHKAAEFFCRIERKFSLNGFPTRVSQVQKNTVVH